MSIDESLEMITDCFSKTINSVTMQIPNPQELNEFKLCVRKYARVKLRCIQTYEHIHAGEDLLYKNLQLLKPLKSAEMDKIVLK